MTTPDPRLAREIARKAVRYAAAVHAAAFVGPAIAEHAVMEEILASGDKSAYGALCNAARAEVPAVFAEIWPDEQAQAERDVDDRAEYVTNLLRDLTDPDPCHYDHHGGCQAHGFLSLEDGEKCPHALARAFLSGARLHTAALAAGRDADVRAVARLLRELHNYADVNALKSVTRVEERFAGRIAALDTRTTNGGVS